MWEGGGEGGWACLMDRGQHALYAGMSPWEIGLGLSLGIKNTHVLIAVLM